MSTFDSLFMALLPMPSHFSKLECYPTHMLRNNVNANIWDRVHVTLIIIITYFLLLHIHVNVADLLIYYIKNLLIINDSNFCRKPNLALGHLIAYILEVEYNISYPTIYNKTPSTNHSINIFL